MPGQSTRRGGRECSNGPLALKQTPPAVVLHTQTSSKSYGSTQASVHTGLTKVWNMVPVVCNVLERIVRVVNPQDVVWHPVTPTRCQNLAPH